jgi:glutamate carboxypeptidase
MVVLQKSETPIRFLFQKTLSHYSEKTPRKIKNLMHMKVQLSDRILNFLNARHSEMVAFIRQLVLLESPTSNPSAQGPLLDLLQDTFQAMGFFVLRMPGSFSGGYLMARPRQRTKHQPLQLLIGHCDTVWPVGTLLHMPLKQDSEIIKGPGIYDMKAGITQMVFALKALKALRLSTLYTPVILINSDEERGSRDSTHAIRLLAKISSRAFILEPPLGIVGKLKTARKGLGRFNLTVKGVPAHAGLDPGKGASAILELSHLVQRLFALNDFEKGITVNVGMIEGGTQANVIASESKAVIDVRVLTAEDGEKVTNEILNLTPVHPDVRLEITGGIGRPPMEKTKRNEQLWLAARNKGLELGLDLKDVTAGGGSDGNTTSLYTATLDGLGTTGDGAHATHEFIYSSHLVERTALLTLLLTMHEP